MCPYGDTFTFPFILMTRHVASDPISFKTLFNYQTLSVTRTSHSHKWWTTLVKSISAHELLPTELFFQFFRGSPLAAHVRVRAACLSDARPLLWDMSTELHPPSQNRTLNPSPFAFCLSCSSSGVSPSRYTICLCLSLTLRSLCLSLTQSNSTVPNSHPDEDPDCLSLPQTVVRPLENARWQ